MRQKRFIARGFWLLTFLALVFFGLSSLPKPTPKLKLGDVCTSLQNLPEIKLFFIAAKYSGQFGGGRTSYIFERYPVQFSTQATYYSYKNEPKSSWQDVKQLGVPQDALESFLRETAQLEIYPGPFKGKPSQLMDSYSRIEFLIQTKQGSLKIYAERTSLMPDDNEYNPWSIEFTGKLYTVENAAPYKAWLTLKPYLKNEANESKK